MAKSRKRPRRGSGPPADRKPAGPSSSRTPISPLWGLLPALLAVVLYANTLGNGYVLDDPLVILQHEHVQKGLAGIGAIFTTNMLNGVHGFNDGLYRPLVLVTYAVEHQLFGNSPAAGHAVNVLLYALAGWLAFTLLRAFFPERHPAAPLLMALLFVAHPVHTEAVANIKGRDEILAFLGIAAALLFLVRYARVPGPRDLAAGLGFAALAFLSKESAITLVAAAPIVLWFTTRAPARRLVVVTASLAGLMLVLLAWRQHVIASMPTPMDPGIVGVLNNSVLSAPGPLGRLATALTLQPLYLWKLLVPLHLVHDYSYNQIPAVGFLSPQALLSLLLVAGLLAAAVWGLRRKHPVSLGILFYAVTLFAVSNLVFRIGATFAERFLFTPSLGFAIAAGWFLAGPAWRATDRTASLTRLLRARPLLTALGAAVLAGYAVRTVDRNADWRSDFTLFAADVAHADRSARAHYNYGTQLYEAGRAETDAARRQELIAHAIAELRRAVAIYPEYPDALNNLGNSYTLAGAPDSAVATFRRALGVDSTYARARLGLGLARFNQGQFEDAVPFLERYLDTHPQAVEAWQALGKSYGRLGRMDRAVDALERASALDPRDVNLLKDLAVAYGMSGDDRRALETALRAAERDPRDAVLLRNIAVSYARLGDETKSQEYMERAQALEAGASP